MRRDLPNLDEVRRLGRRTLSAVETLAPRSRRPAPPPLALSYIALAAGAFALGAVAVGAFAIGRLSIGRMAIARARIRRLEVDELVVKKLYIGEQTGPDQKPPG